MEFTYFENSHVDDLGEIHEFHDNGVNASCRMWNLAINNDGTIEASLRVSETSDSDFGDPIPMPQLLAKHLETVLNAKIEPAYE